MKISVKVKAGSRLEKIEQTGHGAYALWVKAPAKEGKANFAVVALLSEHLRVPKSRITILRGHTAAHKIIEVLV